MTPGSAEHTSSTGRPARTRRQGLVFRPGAMPPLYGDTAATLIVDDDPIISELLVAVLQRDGYRCTVASSAAEARAKLAEREYALALVDVMMPDESGLELAADMLRQNAELAVVMMSAVDDPHIADLALASGAYGYLVKPFRPNQVLITVATAGRLRCLEIERRRYEERLERLVDERPAPE